MQQSSLPPSLLADLWQQELAARGGDPAACHPHPAALLLPLLCHPHQHRTAPAPHPPGSRRLQVRWSCALSITASSLPSTVGLREGGYGHCPSLTKPLVSPRLTQRYVMAFVPALPVSPCGHPGCWSHIGTGQPASIFHCTTQPLLSAGLISSNNLLFRRCFCITWRRDTCRTR